MVCCEGLEANWPSCRFRVLHATLRVLSTGRTRFLLACTLREPIATTTSCCSTLHDVPEKCMLTHHDASCHPLFAPVAALTHGASASMAAACRYGARVTMTSGSCLCIWWLSIALVLGVDVVLQLLLELQYTTARVQQEANLCRSLPSLQGFASTTFCLQSPRRSSEHSFSHAARS